MTAQETRCVKETFDCSVAARWSLMSRRFSSSSLIGIWRCVVAVGTARLASMFSAIRSGAAADRLPLALDRRPERGPGSQGRAGAGGGLRRRSGSPKRSRK